MYLVAKLHRYSFLIGLAAFLTWAPPILSQSPVPVQVTTVQAAPVAESLSVTGTVTSPQRAVLSPAIAGLVQSVVVEVGNEVETGDPVLALDAELAELAVQRARAAVVEAEAARAEAQRRFEEASALDSTAIPVTEVRSRQAAVDVADAVLQAASATLAERTAESRRHSLTAPFAGTVVQRLAEQGEWIAPGDGVIELVATGELWFDFQLPQSYLNRVSTDSQPTLRLEALPDQAFPARIVARVRVAESSARTFLLRLTAEEAVAAGAAPGMSAQLELPVDTGRSAPVVSRDAVIRYPDGRVTVWVVDENGSSPAVVERRVRLGVDAAGGLEITEGLEAGERVVVRGNESLREGVRVRIEP